MIALPTLNDMPESCSTLLNHWNEIRGGELVPRRSELDPARLVAILPRMQIIEIRSRSIAHCKLSGTGLRDLYGFDCTGYNFIELAPPPFRPTRSYRLSSAVQRPCASRFRGWVAFASGVRAQAAGIALPLLPNQAGGFPLLVSVVDRFPDLDWVNRRGAGLIGMPEQFEFFDIGAGVPDRIDPPDDWDMG